MNKSNKPSKWIELSYQNWEETIQAYDYTCVLLYDPVDDDALQEQTNLLEDLMDRQEQEEEEEESVVSVGYARLNGRHHSSYQQLYTLPKMVKTMRPSDRTSFKALAETLLDVSLGTPREYWPNQFLLLARRDYNLYQQLDLSTLEGNYEEKVHRLQVWWNQIKSLPTDPILRTRYNKEKEKRIQYDMEGDHLNQSFNMDAYNKAAAAMKAKAGTTTEEEQDSSFRRHVALVLETDAVEVQDKTTSPFVYDLAMISQFWPSKRYLAELMRLLCGYLGWVEGYESLWTEQRKDKEDAEIHMKSNIDK